MIRTNYHTHTNYCDGMETPEALVKEAIQKGFHILGFSGHSVYPFASDWHIPVARIQEYVAEIKRLQHSYQNRIEILCGFEADYLPPISNARQGFYRASGADYLIGSLHYVVTDTGCFAIDGPTEEVAEGIRQHFKGDGKKAVQTYFSQQRDMIALGGFEILGHADLVRKRNGLLQFFDEEEPWYKDELKETAKAIARSGVIVEINTGGMARKATTTPYPSPYFLSLLNRHQVPITICSDAHNQGYLDFGFHAAIQEARQAGYREASYLTKKKDRLEHMSTSLTMP